MKTILLTLAATTLTLVAVPATQANPKASPGHGSTHTSFKDYHLSHGTKFEHGFMYKGKNHEHWGESRFDHRYGCKVYWDRGLSAWYYWCERDICFYPVSYCPYRTFVCPPPIIVEPVRPSPRPVVVEPVRPVIPAPVAVPAPTNVRVNVHVNVETASALPGR